MIFPLQNDCKVNNDSSNQCCSASLLITLIGLPRGHKSVMSYSEPSFLWRQPQSPIQASVFVMTTVQLLVLYLQTHLSHSHLDHLMVITVLGPVRLLWGEEKDPFLPIRDITKHSHHVHLQDHSGKHRAVGVAQQYHKQKSNGRNRQAEMHLQCALLRSNAESLGATQVLELTQLHVSITELEEEKLELCVQSWS